ncbi:hypothetical protein [Paraburkholderia sp. UCT2]|uniref:hypothetical protein n=1 Tax=Paraburkholderia sp. UCT2 TaxID=2615208 RepID=UPI00223B6683|nr:hypothetical protein [Paraburkholderia sp. UCT2]
MLAMNSHELSASSMDNVRRMLRRGIDLVADGQLRAYARQAYASEKTVAGWMSAETNPTLTAISRLSWVFGIRLRSWLMGDLAAWEKSCHRVLPANLVPRGAVSRQVRASAEKWNAIESWLRASLAGNDPYPSLAAAARDLKVCVTSLRDHFPDLSKRICAAGRRSRSAVAASRKVRNAEKMSSAIRAAIRRLVSEGVKPSSANVAKLMFPGRTELFPRERRIYCVEMAELKRVIRKLEGRDKNKRSFLPANAV